MCTVYEDFEQAIENLQEERRLQKKRPYDVLFHRPVPADPEFIMGARIQGGRSGHRVEVYLTAKGCKVIIPETDVEKTFKKNDLNGVINCIKDLLETPLTNQ